MRDMHRQTAHDGGNRFGNVGHCYAARLCVTDDRLRITCPMCTRWRHYWQNAACSLGKRSECCGRSPVRREGYTHELSHCARLRIYTSEIACVGMTKQAAIDAGYRVKAGSFDVAGNGRSMVMDERVGTCQIISDETTGEILGAQIMAPRASDMIAQIAAVMRCEGTIEELADTIYPHPTVSEIIMEASHDILGLSCHKMPRKNS